MIGGRLAGWQDSRVGFQGRLLTRLTSREDLGREWFWPLMAGRTSGGHIRVAVKLTAERLERLAGRLHLLDPSRPRLAASTMLSALGTRLSLSWRARTLTYKEGSERAHHEADSIPSSPEEAAPPPPPATETAYQGGRNSGWTCQPCPIDWTVWLHYSCLCRSKSPQTMGVRSQLVVNTHLQLAVRGAIRTVSYMHAYAAWCTVYTHSLPWQWLCMYLPTAL